jgi:hypothetical protein
MQRRLAAILAAAVVGYAIMTLWDRAADFERFKGSPALAELGKLSQGLTIRPYSELLFDLVPDAGAPGNALPGLP